MSIDHIGPGVAPFVQIVEEGDQSVIDLGQAVVARVAVNEGVRRIAWSLERHHAFAVIDAKFGEGAADRVRLAQVFDDFELRDFLRAIWLVTGFGFVPASSRLIHLSST